MVIVARVAGESSITVKVAAAVVAVFAATVAVEVSTTGIVVAKIVAIVHTYMCINRQQHKKSAAAGSAATEQC